MTRKLYYEDPWLLRWESAVTGCVRVDGAWEICLDATVFYPEGGGQPWDQGYLGGVRVLAVTERDGEVIHRCDGPLAVGRTVEGQVDRHRRLALMQQHTGEHMVSGTICRRYGVNNVGFHVGSTVVTIDFDGPVPPEDLPKIQAQVNEAIWQDLKVECFVPDRAALEKIPYRSKKALEGPVRIVRIGEVDSCACCGVHVTSTGQVGLVKLLSCVKFHQGVRIEMACGHYAMDLLERVFDQNRQVSQTFSAKLLHTGEAARAMADRLAQAQYQIGHLQRQLFDQIGEGFRGAGNVLLFREDLEGEALRLLADRIAQSCGGTAAVFVPAGTGHRLCLASRTQDVRPLGDRLRQALSAKAGGRREIVQGAVPADRAKIRDFFHTQGWDL